jgi:hypothetical protein
MKKLTTLAAAALAFACNSASAGLFTVYQNSGPITIATNSDNALAQQSFSQTINQPMIVSFDVTWLSGAIGSNDFVALWFGYDTTGTANDKNIAGSHTSGPNIGVKGQTGTGTADRDLFVRDTGTGATYLNGSAMAVATSYHVFGELLKTSGSSTYNTFRAWVDPTAAEMSSLTGWDAVVTQNSGISELNAFGIRSANLTTSGGSADQVRISNVTIQAIPEPGTLALLGLGSLGLAFVGRRKANAS